MLCANKGDRTISYVHLSIEECKHFVIQVSYTQKGTKGYFEIDAGSLHLCENKELI